MVGTVCGEGRGLENPKLKKNLGGGVGWKMLEGGRAGRWEAGVDGWTDEQAQTNLLLQLLRSWGHNNALMDKLYS